MAGHFRRDISRVTVAMSGVLLPVGAVLAEVGTVRRRVHGGSIPVERSASSCAASQVTWPHVARSDPARRHDVCLGQTQEIDRQPAAHVT